MRPDDIAKCVFEAFDKLPAKCKPLQTSNPSKREWVPLSGIVLERGKIMSCI
jgi:tRNA-specific adenosine deaminase 1